MTNRFLSPVLLCVALTSACSSAVEPNPPFKTQYEELLRYLETPQYGLEQELTGKLMFGMETSIIGLREKERTACELPRNVDGRGQPCWLTFTERGTADLKRLSRADFPKGGEYWAEGTGRIAIRPGGFGHMSDYTCQVELSALSVFEKGPPRFWEPPPLLVK